MSARLNFPRPVRLAPLLALLLTGCVPGVAWLPDSSGIVYTAGKNCERLMLYDLEKGESRTIVADTKAATFWPAVCPDGKRVAVARVHTERRKPPTAQIVIYGLDGREQKRSKVFDWPKMPGKGEEGDGDGGNDGPEWLPQLFWSPGGDKILLHAEYAVGVYDVRADSLVAVKESLLLTFGGSPLRPDGAGFLVMKNVHGWAGDSDKGEHAAPRFSLVGWDGRKKAIRPPKLLLDKEALKQEKDLNKLMALLQPVLYDSGWDEETARVQWNVDRLRYDTDKGEAVLDTIEPQRSDDDRLIMNQFRFANGTRLRVVALHEKDKPDSFEKVRVEVVPRGKGEPKVVAEKENFCVLVPSPNRRMVAVRSFALGKQRHDEQPRERLLIVDHRGEVLADLHVPR